jgi:hypothetical protein
MRIRKVESKRFPSSPNGGDAARKVQGYIVLESQEAWMLGSWEAKSLACQVVAHSS